MELHEYPRPTNDTGIGVHWTTGYATAIGMRQIREFWLPELKALGVKWVKIYNHDGALDFAELLLAEGIMPIVRIYRPTPNPSRLDVKDVVQIDAFLRIGARYFEFNSEPDRDAEWKGGRMPANGINLVVENTIANLEIILERGGMPAVPAVSSGSRWDLVGKIVAFGRKDLFAGPVWQAIHNYARNRPIDYPYDIGNQEGAAYTYRFYQTLNEEAWSENAWRGRSLDEINRLRSDRSNPGATVMDDAGSWLAYEYFDALNQKHLGHSIPLLSTECGYLIGEDVDPRYPATTPDLHMAQTLEAVRVMMGTSQRFAPAPDYYFCTAFWLLGNALLGSTSSWWETHAWYSERWKDGALPVVFALKAEPKVARHWHGEVADDLVTIHGTVTHAGDYRTLQLLKQGEQIAQTTLDAHSRYQFASLAPGKYELQIPGAGVSQQLDLSAGQETLVLDFDLTPTRAPVSKSRIEGTVRGGAGAVLMLVRSDDGEEWVTMVKDDGTFRFVDLPAGTYSLRVNPQGSRIERLVLDGINQRTVELAVAGWGYTIRPVPSAIQERARLNSIFVAVDGQRGLPVRVHAGEWSSEPVYTGTAPDVGDYSCELTGLEPAHYIVAVDGVPDMEGRYTQLEARVQVDRSVTLFVEFVYTDMMVAPLNAASRIEGHVLGAGTANRVILIDSMGRRSETAVAANGAFAFTQLQAGLYSVAVLGHEDVTTKADLAVDGVNVVTVELALPLTPGESVDVQSMNEARVTQSIIHGIVPNGVGKLARLVDRVGNEHQQYVDADQRFYFAALAAGSYTLFVDGGYVESNLTVDGHNGLEVHFAELLPSWDVEVSTAGSMPGYSLVRVEVEGMRSLPVRIWKDDWEGMVRETGSKPDYGPFTLEFSPLDPGHYWIEPNDLGLWAEVDLTGLEALWVHFRRKNAPLGQNRVIPMARAERQTVPHPDDYTQVPSLSAAANATVTEEPVAPQWQPFPAQTEEDLQTMPTAESMSAEATDVAIVDGAMGKPSSESQTPSASTDAAVNHDAAAGLHAVDSAEGRRGPTPVPTSTPSQLSPYLFLYAMPKSMDDLAALLHYVACVKPQIGRDRWAAFDAEEVIIVGGHENALDVQEFVRALEAAEVHVTVLAEHYEEQLATG